MAMKVLVFALVLVLCIAWTFAEETCKKKAAEIGFEGLCMSREECEKHGLAEINGNGPLCKKEHQICCHDDNPIPPQNAAVKESSKIDIYVIIENSRDVTKKELQTAKRAVQQLIKKLTIGPDNTRISLLIFSDKAKFLSSISSGTDAKKLKRLINSIKTTTKKPDFPKAFITLFAYAKFLLQQKRPDAKDVILAAVIGKDLSADFVSQVIEYGKTFTNRCMFMLYLNKESRENPLFTALEKAEIAKGFPVYKKMRKEIKKLYRDITTCKGLLD